MANERHTGGDGKGEEAAEHRVHADQDWKKAVEEERRRLREQEGEARPRREPGAQEPAPYPEPSIPIFMAGLYTQTLMALGELEMPGTGKRVQNLAEAGYLIDTIALLQGKMAGNLDEEESAYVQTVLTDLRMRYVSASGGPAGEAKRE